MATLQLRNGSYRVSFCHGLKQHTFTIGKVSEQEAGQWKTRTEQLVMRLNQGLLEIPPGCSAADFMANDGKPPVDPALKAIKAVTLAELRTQYEAAYSHGAIEANTLYTIRLHLDRIQDTLGKRFILSGLTLGKLQGHIDRRSESVTPVTIKKEIDSFRSVWNYGVRAKLVAGTFPSTGLVYSKTAEKLPFMSWKEIERRIKQGGDPDQLWECLYLDAPQIAELLKFVKIKKAPSWVYPMLATAAHTGMRRSELIRARVEDIDLGTGVITVREKKRTRGTVTTRRVPISKQLAGILKDYLKSRHDSPYVFGYGQDMLSVQTTQKAINRLLAKSKWDVCAKWHLFRHSFISACAIKGIDARMLQEWVGHQSAAMTRRYTHLLPNAQADALSRVFA